MMPVVVVVGVIGAIVAGLLIVERKLNADVHGRDVVDGGAGIDTVTEARQRLGHARLSAFVAGRGFPGGGKYDFDLRRGITGAQIISTAVGAVIGVVATVYTGNVGALAAGVAVGAAVGSAIDTPEGVDPRFTEDLRSILLPVRMPDGQLLMPSTAMIALARRAPEVLREMAQRVVDLGEQRATDRLGAGAGIVEQSGLVFGARRPDEQQARDASIIRQGDGTDPDASIFRRFGR